MSDRLFSLKPEIKLSAEEGKILMDAWEKMHGSRKEVGHIVKEIAQKAVEDAVARYTMQQDRG